MTKSGEVRWVLVTGATGGIGRAICASLADANFRVIEASRSCSDGPLGSRGSNPSLRIDLEDEDSIASAVAGVTAIVGEAGLYGLVHNAGVAIPAPFELQPFRQ